MEASEHSYIVSDIIPDLGNIPNLRVPEDAIYTKVGTRSPEDLLWSQGAK
jgi:hypothetical protein